MKRPKIAIDARMIGPTKHGISEYVRDMVFGLAAIKDKPYDLQLLVGKTLPEWDSIREIPFTTTKTPFLSPFEVFEIPLVLKKLGACLFHSPSFAAFPFNYIPTAYTVHDLNHLHFGNILKRTYFNHLLKPCLLKSPLVITVSEFSRQELSEWLSLPKEKIKVVHNAIHVESPPSDWENQLTKLGLKKYGFHLTISNPRPHKNIPVLIEAFLKHLEINPEAWPLVINLSQEEVGVRHPKIKLLGTVGESERTSLLAGAGAFYFLSLYEGFGRPPLEAATFGCPIVASDIAPHRETLSNQPDTKLLSPRNHEAWVNSFKWAEQTQFNRIKKTLLAPYTREFLAAQMDGFYREVLNLL